MTLLLLMCNRYVPDCVLQALLVACMTARSLCAAVTDGCLDRGETPAVACYSVTDHGITQHRKKENMTVSSTQMALCTDNYAVKQFYMGPCFCSP